MTSWHLRTCFALALMFALPGGLDGRSPDRPNIIFLMIDDCSAVELSCYATPEHPAGNQTPVMDRLAREGLRFETCWATPLCMPTRALFISGKYAPRTRQWGNRLNDFSPDFPARHTPISKRLKDHGYATAISGKWHLPGSPEDPAYGWDEYAMLGGYLNAAGPNPEWEGRWFSWDAPAETFLARGIVGKNGNIYPALYWNGCVIVNGEVLPNDENTYAPDACQAFALDFISRHDDEPFFLYYPIVLTHDPWFPTPDPDSPTGRSAPGMAAQVTRLEKYVDELVTHLKAEGVYENTVVILTADNATLAYGKGSCSEFGVRVPLIVFGGAVKGSGVSPALVDFADMYPTILELAGIQPTPEMDLDGISFKPAIDGLPFEGKPFLFSYRDRERTVRDRTHTMDSHGGIWACAPSGNFLDYTPLEENEQTAAIREKLLAAIADYPAPAPDDFDGRAPIEWDPAIPAHNPEVLDLRKLGDNWMHHPRRMRP